jgi:uncharacterized protein DUF4383
MQMVTHVLMEVQMVKRVAMFFGVLFLVVGALGLAVSGGMQMGDSGNPAMLLGMFPVNVLHNVVHLAFGVWGVLAARSYNGAVAYCKLAGFAYLCLAGLGMIVPAFFGLIPIGGNDVFLHAVFGVFLVWVGFTAKEETAAAATA